MFSCLLIYEKFAGERNLEFNFNSILSRVIAFNSLTRVKVVVRKCATKQRIGAEMNRTEVALIAREFS